MGGEDDQFTKGTFRVVVAKNLSYVRHVLDTRKFVADLSETGLEMTCSPVSDLLWVQITQSYPNRLRFWILPSPESPVTL